MLKFLLTLALDFPCICLQFFPGNFLVPDKCSANLKEWFWPMKLHVTPSDFFSRIVRSEALVHNAYFFQDSRLRKLFDVKFSYTNTVIFHAVATRQDGFQNRDKVYCKSLENQP